MVGRNTNVCGEIKERLVGIEDLVVFIQIFENLIKMNTKTLQFDTINIKYDNKKIFAET